MKHKIRLARIDDIPVIYDLGKEIFDWNFEKISWSISLVAWFFEKHIELCLVAEVDNKVVGFILGFVRQKSAYIGWIAVKENYRKSGIGSSLIMTFLKQLKGTKINTFGSHVRNDIAALSLFRSCGFSDINETKIEMALDLNTVQSRHTFNKC